MKISSLEINLLYGIICETADVAYYLTYSTGMKESTQKAKPNGMNLTKCSILLLNYSCVKSLLQ